MRLRQWDAAMERVNALTAPTNGQVVLVGAAMQREIQEIWGRPGCVIQTDAEAPKPYHKTLAQMKWDGVCLSPQIAARAGIGKRDRVRITIEKLGAEETDDAGKAQEGGAQEAEGGHGAPAGDLPGASDGGERAAAVPDGDSVAAGCEGHPGPEGG
jgi:hypothetical protein